MNFYPPFKVFLLATLAMSASLAGCQSREARAKKAFDSYQAASATGDLVATRNALLQLVAQDDSSAQYWTELGKVQLAQADYGGAYNAFVRAHELDRANPEILAVLTQITLRSGNLDLAEKHARELELVASADPAVPLTFGYVALRRDDIAAATDHATKLLAATPYDSSAKVLKSRILLRSGKPDDAIALLREQIRLQPSDVLSLRALMKIFERRDQWSDASAIARSLIKWQAEDQGLRTQLIEYELLAGDVVSALRNTTQALPSADARQIEALLAPWSMTGRQDLVTGRVFIEGKAATGVRRLALARFLVFQGKPDDALMLAREMATLPATPASLAANALFGAALAQSPQDVLGAQRLDMVLNIDSGNFDALRSRAAWRSKKGSHKQAIEDGRKLVSIDRRSAQARLLLARIHFAAGQSEEARRVLWTAFHDIPADRTIYSALKTAIAEAEGLRVVQRLDQEFTDQRDAAMTRSFG